MDSLRNVVIIGSGPAAWAAAIYTARAELRPLVIAGEQPGGQLMLTTQVENYPGFKNGIQGPELITIMRQQSERAGTEVIDQNATKINRSNNHFNITYSNNSVNTRAVIIATGAVANTLKIPGEERLMGRGVGTCAVCDAPFYRGKDIVFVVGGGDSAMEESLALSKFAKRVVLLVRRDALRASKVLQKRIETAQNIEIWYKSEARELLGDQKLEKVKISREGSEEVHNADGLFYAIGHTPATKFLEDSSVKLDEKGYIKTGLNFGFGALEHQSKFFPTETSVQGVFAAGDCVDSRYRQAVTAAGFGAMAALDAEKWLQSK